LSELYPKKPIYDIPGFPEVLAGDLVDNLMEQIKQFEPGLPLENVLKRLKKEDGSFIVTSNEGSQFHSKVVQSQVV
jgi:thioredoxin reductase (NADPH)